MKKNNTLLIALVIAVPLSLYAGKQAKLDAENYKDDFVQRYTNKVQELAEIIPEEIQEETTEYISLGEFKLTAYCSCEKCCGNWANNRSVDEEGNEIVIGASGEILEEIISIAVDKNVIPYGSKVLINGQEHIAHDCGGAIKNNRIDVYMASHEEALAFGVQYAEVFLMKEGENNG